MQESGPDPKGTGSNLFVTPPRSLFQIFYLLCAEGGTNSTAVDAGESQYPFQVLLPPGLPASFEGLHGRVRYTVQASLDGPRKASSSITEGFSIATLLDLNREPFEFRVRVYLHVAEPPRCFVFLFLPTRHADFFRRQN